MGAAGASVSTRIGKLATATPQVLVTVYLIVSPPNILPVTMPVGVTVSIAGNILLHTPPVAVLERATDEPRQILDEPVMVPATGNVSTVSIADKEVSEPVPLVTTARYQLRPLSMLSVVILRVSVPVVEKASVSLNGVQTVPSSDISQRTVKGNVPVSAVINITREPIHAAVSLGSLVIPGTPALTATEPNTKQISNRVGMENNFFIFCLFNFLII
jgi:hypothetical protein